MNSTLILEITNDVYNSLGPGYNEVIYHRALEVGLRLNGISYQSEVITPVVYKGHNVGYGRVDLMLNDLIIELKAISKITIESIIQIKNYMKHHQINNGMVINFGQSTKSSSGQLEIHLIQHDRIINLITNEVEML